MSQYPPSPYSYPMPYQTPAGYSYDPFGQHLGPARRAGILMIILGALVAVYAACNAIAMFAVPADQLMRNNPMMTKEAAQISPDVLKTTGVIVSVLILLVGLAKIILGVFVRRNSGGAIVGGLILTALVTVVVGLFAVTFAFAGLAAPPAFVVSCLLFIPLALLVLELVWLVQAMRAGTQIRAMQAQYHAQFHQYQQQQQAYAQQYGYGQPMQPQPQAQQPPASEPPPSTLSGGGGADGTSTQG
jgi:hypothetical protein